MAGGEDDGTASAALLLPPAAGERRRCREGCPGCRVEEENKARVGIPYRNFFYIWVVCLVAGQSSFIRTPPFDLRCWRYVSLQLVTGVILGWARGTLARCSARRT
jgi:hypothetical protein